MVYLDTSFVAPWVIAENSSDAVEAFVLKVKAKVQGYLSVSD